MSVLVVGINHRTADFELLERVAVSAEELPKAVRATAALEHVDEAVVLSTCNRVEIYVRVNRFHAGLHEVLSWLASRGDLAPRELEAVHYAYHDDRAAAHLFAVASGVDSMVVGERQIALQVKEAARVARDEDTSGHVLHRLFDQALHASRRIRGETAISQGASSLVDVGMDVATRTWDTGVQDRTVLIVGAGKLGGLTADWLDDAAPSRVLVRNRTPDKATRLAARVDGQTVPDDGLVEALAASDLVVCCTGAAMPVLDVDTVARGVRDRDPGRPLVLLDLGMPRNVEADCEDLDSVVLVDLEGVRNLADRTVTGATIEAARHIVEEEAGRFRAWTAAAQVDPTIKALHLHAESIRQEELERLGSRLADLDEREREAVDALTEGIVNTLLHDPTVRLKALAAAGGGAEEYATALRDLFGLDDE